MNKYQYIRELGKGSNGRIFLSYYHDDNQIKRYVAIKEISSSNQDGQENIHPKKEIKIIQQLIDCQNQGKLNQNVLNCYEIFTQDSNQYIVSEFCEYGNLQQHLNQYFKFYNIEQLLNMIIQITNGVDNLHNIGITHHDLKPESVLITQVDGSFFLKITDFGISSIQNMKSPVRSVKNLAPEVLSKGKYSKETDIWSLGCLIYEIIYNQQLFTTSSQAAIAKSILQFKKYRNHDYRYIYKELNSVIKKCLNVNPEERPTSKDILQSLQEIKNQYFNQNAKQLPDKNDYHIKPSSDIKENLENSENEQDQYEEKKKPTFLNQLLKEVLLQEDELQKKDIQNLSKRGITQLVTTKQIKQFDTLSLDGNKSIDENKQNQIIIVLLLLHYINENQEDGYEKLSKQLMLDDILSQKEKRILLFYLIQCTTEENTKDKINQFFQYLKNSLFQYIINKLSKQKIQYKEDIDNINKIKNLTIAYRENQFIVFQVTSFFNYTIDTVKKCIGSVAYDIIDYFAFIILSFFCIFKNWLANKFHFIPSINFSSSKVKIYFYDYFKESLIQIIFKYINLVSKTIIISQLILIFGVCFDFLYLIINMILFGKEVFQELFEILKILEQSILKFLKKVIDWIFHR